MRLDIQGKTDLYIRGVFTLAENGIVNILPSAIADAVNGVETMIVNKHEGALSAYHDLAALPDLIVEGVGEDGFEIALDFEQKIQELGKMKL